jgi:hypothetical protein
LVEGGVVEGVEESEWWWRRTEYGVVELGTEEGRLFQRRSA